MLKTNIIADTLDNWLSVPGNNITTHYQYNHNRFYFNGYIYFSENKPVFAVVYSFNRYADEKISKKETFDVLGWAMDDINSLFPNRLVSFNFKK